MHLLATLLLLVLSSPALTSSAWAAETIVKDGATLRVGNATYRLDGIDAPELDQICVDDHSEPWACGVEARDRLASLIRTRKVLCDDLGPNLTFRKRRIGACRFDGEQASLNQQLVAQGFALNFEPSAGGRFTADEADARKNKKGLWRGCFVAPQALRQWKTTTPLLGASCPADKDSELRNVLFPKEPTSPPGCPIKAKLAIRARVTGYIGVYQLQGCPSYASLTKPNRWFCSEDDAQAAGFRRAFNCPAGARSR